MQTILPSEDIRPISELGGHTAKFLKDAQRTRRPIFLTSRGKAAGVLIDIEEYERLLERIAFHETILAAEAEAKRGEVVSHAQLERESRQWIKTTTRPKSTKLNGPKRRNGR
ncbi:type II toxin-antitoxin system Phd/YefM family antitoxin [candidate division KSB1 bacterium]|nr:type II toxin-antitoxin system Phd/YefM family antitoxin [candidate division KSB1 bacterium]